MNLGTLRAWLTQTQHDVARTQAQVRHEALLRYEAAAREGGHDNEELEDLYFAATSGLPIVDPEERATAQAQARALRAIHRHQLEAAVCRDLEEAFRLGGWSFLHFPDSRGSHTVGWPDYFAARGGGPDLPGTVGEVVAIEAKREHGRLTPEQVAWLERLRGCGIECHVVRPSTVVALRERLLRPLMKKEDD